MVPPGEPDRTAEASAGLYREIAERSPNPVWIFDAGSLDFLWVNPAAQATYGYSEEEFLSLRVTDVRPPEDVEAFLAHLRRVAEDPDPGRIWRHRTKGGALLDVETSGGPVSYQGRPARFAIMRDVTGLVRARRDAEARARRLEALHAIDRAIIEGVSVAEIARAALERLREAVACDRASLMLLGPVPGEGRLFVLGHEGPTRVPEGETFALAPYRGILERVRSEGVYLCEDLSAEEGLPPILARLRGEGLASLLSLPLRRSGELLGTLALYSRRASAFGAEETEVAGELADQLAIAIAQVELRDRERTLAAERLRLLSDLVTAQEEERRRISGDLHDDVLQKTTALAMRLDLATGRHPELEEDPQLARLREVLAESIAALRTATFRLRPPELDRRGLAETLRAYLAQEIGEAPIAYSVDAELESRLPDALRTTLFRIAQEAIVNALKHAGASTIEVRLREGAGGFLMRVADDGRGWEAGGRPESPAGHLGLTSMRERAEAAGGWLRIESSPGAGATLECFVPH